MEFPKLREVPHFYRHARSLDHHIVTRCTDLGNLIPLIILSPFKGQNLADTLDRAVGVKL
jgi:hypothetical protein